MIAESDERAGIACYMVNGVCHQAANRILIPTGETVAGARGYKLSVVFFGVYGRPKTLVGLCEAPLCEHEGVSGDLSECLAGEPQAASGSEANSDGETLLDFLDVPYMAAVIASYAAFSAEVVVSRVRLFDFQIEQFKLFVQHAFPRPKSILQPDQYRNLMVAREKFEDRRLDAEEILAETGDGVAFVEEFDELTKAFQNDAATSLTEDQYRALLDLSPDERIVLSDPDIVKAEYGPPAGPRGMAP